MRSGSRHCSRFALCVLFAVSLIVLVVGAGCSGAGAAGPDDTGQVVVALTQVPSDVLCLRLTATGAQTVTRLFDVTPGVSSQLSMNGLPLGNVSFSAEAFSSSCAQVGPSSSPTWVSDPVPAVLTTGVIAAVTLSMHRNGQAVVSVDFGGGQACLADGAACTTDSQCCSAGCVGSVCAPTGCSDVEVPIDAEAFPSGTDLSEAFAAQGVHLSTDVVAEAAAGPVFNNGSFFSGAGGILWSDRGSSESVQILRVIFDSPTDFVSIAAAFPFARGFLVSQGAMEAQGPDGGLLSVGVTPFLDDFGGPSSAVLSVRHASPDIKSVRIFGRAPDDALNDAYVTLAHLRFERHTCAP